MAGIHGLIIEAYKCFYTNSTIPLQCTASCNCSWKHHNEIENYVSPKLPNVFCILPPTCDINDYICLVSFYHVAFLARWPRDKHVCGPLPLWLWGNYLQMDDHSKIRSFNWFLCWTTCMPLRNLNLHKFAIVTLS